MLWWVCGLNTWTKMTKRWLFLLYYFIFNVFMYLCICWSNFKFWTTTVSVKLEKNQDIWAMPCCPDVCFVSCGRTISSISNFQITSPFHHFYRIYIDRDWNVFFCIFLALRHTHSIHIITLWRVQHFTLHYIIITLHNIILNGFGERRTEKKMR